MNNQRNNKANGRYQFYASNIFDGGLLFLFSLIFFTLLFNETPPNGDTYAYAKSIVTFEGPVFHCGYFLIGRLFYLILGNLGFSQLFTIGIISVIFGSLSVGMMYLISSELTNNRQQSILSSLILMFSGDFWLYSVHGEVYVPQLAFILLTIYLILNKKLLIASLACLLALSITPTSILAFPGFFYLTHLKRYSSREKFLFILPILLVFLALVSIYPIKVINLIKWGLYSPKMFFDNFNLFSLSEFLVSKIAKIYFKSFNIILFFGILGFITMFKYNRRLFILVVFFLLPFTTYIFNLGLISGDHLIITFFPVSLLCGFGIYELINMKHLTAFKKKFLYSNVLILHAIFVFIFFINYERDNAQDLRYVIKKLDTLFADRSILISDYDFGMAFWYLTQNENNWYLCTGRPADYLLQDDVDRSSRLNGKFWINAPQIVKYFSMKHDKEYLIEKRPVFIVLKNPPHRTIFNFMKGEMKNKNLHNSQRMNRLMQFLESEMNAKMSYSMVNSSDWYTVYQIYPEFH